MKFCDYCENMMYISVNVDKKEWGIMDSRQSTS